ncbi:unnamed protein product [Brachionus calyciflorus]|uniref:G-protein coupled receptors family 1 profile domain-containing protein n=1 Tax=Brachionus calyciflorus TaxID=104777 RepID=A0A813XFP2_9BILA|nr:unnamed protein product [Brachionus calyciflorus]
MGYMSNTTLLLNDNETTELLIDLQFKNISYLSLIFSGLFGFTFIFGLLTNSLVVVVFLFKSELRQYTNYFFTNLSIADLLVIIVCIPVAISDLLSPDIWNFGVIYCKMYYFIEYCVTSVSSLTIIFISLERYFAISKPLSVKILFNEKNSLITIILIWLVAICVSSPFLLMTEFYQNPDQCQLNMQQYHLIYVFVLNISLIFIPTIGLAFLYIYIIINLRKHYKLFSHSNNEQGNSHGLRVHSRNSLRMHQTNFKRTHQLQEYSKTSSNNSDVRNLNQTKNYRIQKLNNSMTNSVNLDTKNSIFKWKKTSRSCSFCFSGLNSKYECRCDIGNSHEIRSMYLQKNVKKITTDNLSNVPAYSKYNSGNDLVNNSKLQSLKRSGEASSYNKVNFTVVISLITLIFFCCQLPIRIFLLWSYYRHYISPPLIANETPPTVTNEINFINIISYLATLIYFLHCISNPIIYNLLSIKFRRAFLSLGVSHKPCLFKISCKSNC